MGYFHIDNITVLRFNESHLLHVSVPGAGSIFHFHVAVHTSGKENAAFCCDVTNIETSAAKRVGKQVPLGIRSRATDTAWYYTSSVYSPHEKK